MPTNFVINFPGNRRSEVDAETGEPTTIVESAAIKGEYNREESAVYLQIATYEPEENSLVQWAIYEAEMTEEEPPRIKIFRTGSPK